MKFQAYSRIGILLGILGIFGTSCSPEMVLKMKGYKSTFNEKSTYNNDGGEFETREQLASDEGINGILGFSVGAGGEWKLGNNFSYESSLLYARKGAKNVVVGGGGFETTTRLNYLDLPQTVHYEISNTGIEVMAGFQPSILLSAKQKTEFEGEEMDITITEAIKTFDLAGVLGAGYRIDDNWKVNIGYDHGFLNIRKEQDFGGFEQRNRALWLGVTYRFRKKNER